MQLPTETTNGNAEDKQDEEEEPDSDEVSTGGHSSKLHLPDVAIQSQAHPRPK